MAAILFICSFSASWQDTASQPASLDRDLRIRQVLAGDNHDLRMRALLELIKQAEDTGTLDRSVIVWASSPDSRRDDEVFSPLLRVAQNLSPTNIQALLDVFRRSERTESAFDTLLTILARMGPNARQALPFLLELKRQHAADRETMVCVNVVLANIGGEESAAAAEAVRKALRGGSELREMTLEAIAMCGPGSWLGSDLIQGLVVDCAKGSVDAAGTLLQLHGVDAEVRASLREVTPPDRASSTGVLRDFIIAAIDSEQRREKLTSAIQRYDSQLETHTQLAFSLWLPPVLIQDSVKLLQPRNPDVTIPTMKLLSMCGMLDTPSSARLVSILQNGTMREQATAATVLARVGSAEVLPKLERLLEGFSNSPVRTDLAKAIRVLKLQE